MSEDAKMFAKKLEKESQKNCTNCRNFPRFSSLLRTPLLPIFLEPFNLLHDVAAAPVSLADRKIDR